jgi:hypothetical protein
MKNPNAGKPGFTKRGKPIKKDGRKLFDGKNYDTVILKLEQVWGIGGSDHEAARFAEISPASLCQFLKKSEHVSKRKEELKNNPILKARQEIVKGLTNNPEFALKFLERKLPDEFGVKQRVALEGGGKGSEPISIKFEDALPIIPTPAPADGGN